MKHGSFHSFPINNGDLPMNNGDFPWFFVGLPGRVKNDLLNSLDNDDCHDFPGAFQYNSGKV